MEPPNKGHVGTSKNIKSMKSVLHKEVDLFPFSEGPLVEVPLNEGALARSLQSAEPGQCMRDNCIPVHSIALLHPPPPHNH